MKLPCPMDPVPHHCHCEQHMDTLSMRTPDHVEGQALCPTLLLYTLSHSCCDTMIKLLICRKKMSKAKVL